MRYNNIAAVFLALLMVSLPVKAAPLETTLSSIHTNEKVQALDEDTQDQVTCLALNMYHEARGSTYQDILAVGLSTRNRVHLTNKSYCQVIWERGQYVWTTRPVSGISPKEEASWDRLLSIATEIVTGEHEDITAGATSFYSAKIVTPRWAVNRSKVRIGAHYYVKTM